MTNASGATWVVIADGGRGRVFEWDAREHALEAVQGFEMVANLVPSGERWADRAGTVHESAAPNSHTKKPRSDPKENAKNDLARRLADQLQQARNDNRVGKLVLIAPPQFLGRLRQALDGPTRELVVAEHDKDLSGLGESALRERATGLLRGLGSPLNAPLP